MSYIVIYNDTANLWNSKERAIDDIGNLLADGDAEDDIHLYQAEELDFTVERKVRVTNKANVSVNH